MKKALRDLLLIVILFGAVLLAPLAVREFGSSETPGKPAPKPAAEKPAAQQSSTSAIFSSDDQMPPQPQPADAGESPAALGQLAPQDETAPVPANCAPVNLGAGSSYDPAIETRAQNDTFVIDAASAAGMHLDGGGGVDMLRVSGPGDVDVDGEHLVRIEIYNLRNDNPNTLHIEAAALAAMDGRHAMVIGDKSGDKVYLDPCLQWNDPISVEDGPEPLLRYDAHDVQGNPASMSVTIGVSVIKPAQK